MTSSKDTYFVPKSMKGEKMLIKLTHAVAITPVVIYVMASLQHGTMHVFQDSTFWFFGICGGLLGIVFLSVFRRASLWMIAYTSLWIGLMIFLKDDMQDVLPFGYIAIAISIALYVFMHYCHEDDGRAEQGTV